MGLKNLTDEEPVERSPHFHSRFRPPRHHAPVAIELDFIRSWLPDPSMRNELLEHINEILGGKRRGAGKARRSHRKDATEADLEAYLLRYFLEALQAKGYYTDEPADINALKRRLMGHTRFEEISAACQWSEKIIDDLHTDFNHRASLIIFLGQLLGIDETISSYFGKDAQIAKVSRFIPPKPHNFARTARLSRRAVRLRHSGARVTVALVSVTPNQKWTPTAAAQKIIDLVRPNQAASAHYILDSAFATPELLAHITMLSFPCRSRLTAQQAMVRSTR